MLYFRFKNQANRIQTPMKLQSEIAISKQNSNFPPSLINLCLHNIEAMLTLNRKNDLILIMTPEKHHKTSELSKHWSPDPTPARNEIIKLHIQ